jgi:hypothetical protein
MSLWPLEPWVDFAHEAGANQSCGRLRSGEQPQTKSRASLAVRAPGFAVYDFGDFLFDVGNAARISRTDSFNCAASSRMSSISL